MKIGMKKNFAAIALCMAASLYAYADSKIDVLMDAARINAVDTVKVLIAAGADIRSEQSKMAEDIC